MRRLFRLRNRARLRGVVLLDVLLGVFVVTLMAAGIFSLTPTIHRSHDMADEEAKAVLIANRMLEHLQLLKPDTLNGDTLYELNLIDDFDGEVYTFTSTPLDEGPRYSPGAALKNGYGQFTLEEIDGGSVRVELEIGWTSATGEDRHIHAGTIVGGYR